ncbi:MAG: M23 family metallopeptidase [Actinomycetota bacterium]|nr:M23 family metallopeptidase [Actinomycetota bacterium]
MAVGFRATSPSQHIGGTSKLRRRFALAAAAVVVIIGVVGALPFLYALPLIGMLTAWSASPDVGSDARALSPGSGNRIIGSLVLASLAVVAFQGLLRRLLIISFGTDLPSEVVALLSVVVLALPVAMFDSTSQIADLPTDWMVASKRNLLLALTALVTVATWHATVGLSFVVLAALVLGLPMVLVASRLRHARHGVLELGFWRHPLSRGWGMHRLQLLNIVLFVALMGLVALAGTFDIIRLYLPVGGYPLFQVAFGAGLVTLVILGLVPLSHVYWGTNLAVAAGSAFLAVQLITMFQPPTEPVTIVSPLGEEWFVSQGGRAELVNYHYVTSAQRDAFDIVQIVDGRTHPPESTDLDSYHIFGTPLLAPASGVVTSVVDDLADQPIGSADHEHQAGNHLVIDISKGRYLMLAHLREGSINVDVGDRVTAGQVIAQVGNSGNTTEPHVHIQALNLPSFELANEDLVELLRTVRTYPLVLRDVILIRNGSESEPAVVDPRRGDVVRPVP